MMMTDDDIDPRIMAAVRETLIRRTDELLFAALGGTSTTAGATIEKPLSIEKLMRDCSNFAARWRRTQIIVEVSASHFGPILSHKSPSDGTRIECSWEQASEIHRAWPLKLSNVLSEEVAEFVPVSSVFTEYFLRDLPKPPFAVPEERPE
jgi:hypothetical protein